MDDRLRALDRVARGDPHDHSAVWTLIRALDQAGDGIGAWRARSSLARAGVDEACHQLEDLPSGVRRLGPRRVLDLPEGQAVRAASDHGVLVGDASSTQVWDPVTLERRWVDERPVTGRTPAFCGPLLVDAVEPRLLVRAAASGEVLASVPLPFTATSRIEVCGGFALLDSGGSRRRSTTVVDLLEAEPQALPQRLEVEARTVAATRALRLLAGRRGTPRAPSLLARTISDHEARWSVGGHLLAHDSTHVVTESNDQDRGHNLVTVSAMAGQPAWERRLLDTYAPIEARWTPDALVVATNWIGWHRDAATTLDVHALDRTTGETRWRLRHEVGPHVVVRLVPSRDVVVIAYGPPRPNPVDPSWQAVGDLTLCGIDLATGGILWTCAAAPRQTSSLTSSSWLFALDRALLAWIVNEDGRYLVRLEDA